MTILDSVAAQAANAGNLSSALLDPLFLVAVLGSLAFLYILIRFIVDDVDLHGDGEDFASHLSGMAASSRPHDHEMDTGHGKVRPLTPRASDTTPRNPGNRRRPAA